MKLETLEDVARRLEQYLADKEELLNAEAKEMLTTLRAHIAEHDKIAERVSNLVELAYDRFQTLSHGVNKGREIRCSAETVRAELSAVLKMIRGE
jgi:uncharacterized coiled-coil DUF342 family protein